MGKAGRGWTLRTEPDVESGIRVPVPASRYVLVRLDTFRGDHMAILTASLSWRSAELDALRLRLSTMPLSDLEAFYKATHNACRYTETRAPAPAVVQEFVQAWKQLRRVKKRF